MRYRSHDTAKPKAAIRAFTAVRAEEYRGPQIGLFHYLLGIARPSRTEGWREYRDVLECSNDKASRTCLRKDQNPAG